MGLDRWIGARKSWLKTFFELKLHCFKENFDIWLFARHT
jgi:hypothetical protein